MGMGEVPLPEGRARGGFGAAFEGFGTAVDGPAMGTLGGGLTEGTTDDVPIICAGYKRDIALKGTRGAG